MAHSTGIAVHNKLHPRVADQLPEFVKEEGELFVKFLEAYYEWMDQPANALGASQHILEFQDIDKTLDKYVEWFLREVAAEIPQINKIRDRDTVKHFARELYRAKGTPKSYQLLFRMMFDEEIEFYYPGRDLLAPSSGTWQVDTILRISPPYVLPKGVSTIDSIEGRTIVGQTSGATAIVESLITTTASGVEIKEMTLSGVEGSFKQGETVKTNTAPFYEATIFTNIGTIDTITITNGGAFHTVGDAVNLTGVTQGTGANGTVTATTDDSAVNILLANGGSGYNKGTPITVLGGSGDDLRFEIQSLSNTEVISVNDDNILFYKDVRLDGATGSNSAFGVGTGGANNFSTANINSTILSAFTNTVVTVGTINAISRVSYGSGYTVLPGVEAVNEQIAALEITGFNSDFKGRDARFTIQRVPGTITDIEINKRGDKYNVFDEVVISNVPRSANTLIANGSAFPVISGILERPGKYIDSKGFLSDADKIQDNFYYQEFSYVVQSGQFVSAYRGLVNRLLNPAGTKLFGEYDIISEDLTTELATFDRPKYTIILDPGLGALIDYPSVISGSESTFIRDSDVGGVVREDIIKQGDPEFTAAKVLDTVQSTVPDGFDVEIDIEIPPISAEVTTITEVLRFQKAQGTIGISDVATIAAYQTDTIEALKDTAIADATGGNNIVIATGNAALTTILTVGERVIITPSAVQTNGMYQVLSVTSNTSFRIGPAYNFNLLGFGNTFFHVIADDFSSTSDFRFDDTELTFDSSNRTDGTSKPVTLFSSAETFDTTAKNFDG